MVTYWPLAYSYPFTSSDRSTTGNGGGGGGSVTGRMDDAEPRIGTGAFDGGLGTDSGVRNAARPDADAL
jgi:hypothetical protein